MSESQAAKGIFASTAPRYFAAGLAVMPLYPKQKRPIFDDWSKWRHALPTESEQLDWAARYANYNIGLVLGEASNLIAVDVDTDDEALLKVIESVLPPSPWIRKGKRGYVKLYRWNNQRIKHIKDKLGSGIVDILSGGSQVVLPPSIHPDTQQPYESNCDLISVLDQLVEAPEDLYDKIYAALELAGVDLSRKDTKFNTINFVSSGSRDVQMTQYAGLLSNAIQRGELGVKRALNNMRAWCENYVESVAGDPIDMNKGMSKVIEFLLVDLDKRKTVLKPGWDEDLSQEEKDSWSLNFTEEQQEWTYEQLHAYIEPKLREFPDPNDPQKREAIDYFLKKIHKSSSLTSLEVDNLLNFLSKNSGQKLAVSAYKKRLKELGQGEVQGINHTELAQAAIKEFEEKIGQIRYDVGSFWKWSGSHWARVEDSEIEKVVAENFGHMDAAKRYSDISGIRKTMVPLVPRGLKHVDAVGVNFANGFLTEDLRLISHNPDFGMTYTLPFRYLPDAAPPTEFFKLLKSYWGHTDDYQERVQALREAMGATVFGLGVKLQKAICLKGVGGSGKSQLLDILAHLVPDHARCAISPDKWQETYAQSSLYGKLLNVCGELSEKRAIDGKSFKEITAGDEIEARLLYGQFFKFRCSATHWFNINGMPKTKDISYGFKRRWLFLEFDRVIPDNEKILDYGKKIAQQEIEQIAAWAIASVPELLKRNAYTFPASHLRLEEEMALVNSDVRQFIKDVVTMHEGKSCTMDQIYQKYFSYSMQVLRKSSMAPKKFSTEFEEIMAEYSQYEKVVDNDSVTFLHMTFKDIKAVTI